MLKKAAKDLTSIYRTQCDIHYILPSSLVNSFVDKIIIVDTSMDHFHKDGKIKDFVEQSKSRGVFSKQILL